MAVEDFQTLQEKLYIINNDETFKIICSNIKRFRLEKYQEYKMSKTNSKINPYSTENIAALLDYNHNHYKRFESENDSTKRIPFDKLYRLSIILDKSLDDFVKIPE